MMNKFYVILDNQEMIKDARTYTESSNMALFDTEHLDTAEKVDSPKRMKKSTKKQRLLFVDLRRLNDHDNPVSQTTVTKKSRDYYMICDGNKHICTTASNTNLDLIVPSDIEKLYSATFWMRSNDLYCVMSLLRRQFMHFGGLEDTDILYHGMVKNFEVRPENAFIVYTGNHHWVTAYTRCSDEKIFVYDSLYKMIEDNVKQQLDALFHDEKSFELLPLQTQQGGADCGFFAVAVLVEILHGHIDLSKTVFVQNQLRSHFIECIRLRKFRRFPQEQ